MAKRAKKWEVRLCHIKYYRKYYVQGIHASGAGERRSEARDNHPPHRVDHGGLLLAEGAARPPQKGKDKGGGRENHRQIRMGNINYCECFLQKKGKEEMILVLLLNEIF
jgi:hypothetical protein